MSLLNNLHYECSALPTELRSLFFGGSDRNRTCAKNTDVKGLRVKGFSVLRIRPLCHPEFQEWDSNPRTHLLLYRTKLQSFYF